MSIIIRMLKQTAVYWAPLGNNDRYGKPTWDDPVQISCRWESAQDFTKNNQMETAEIADRVYVGQDVAVGGMLMLGSITSGMSYNPLDHATAREIQRFEKLPNLKNTETLRTALLKFGA